MVCGRQVEFTLIVKRFICNIINISVKQKGKIQNIYK